MRAKRGQLIAEPESAAPLSKAELRAKYLNGKSPAQIAKEANAGHITTNGSSNA